MNTFAKIGRIALLRLFTNKEKIFTTTRYEEMGMVKVLLRKVSTAKEQIDLEEEYLGHMVATLGREKNYKIFFWSVELGLTEILLRSHRNEGRLLDLLCRIAGGTFTHVVVAEKREWDDYTELDFHLGKNRDNAQKFAQEEITIYSLTKEQKADIANHIHKFGCDPDSIEEFTRYHGYFPEKI